MHTTTTHDAYVGIPLAELSAKARGDVLEGVVRRVLEEFAGEVATDPVVEDMASDVWVKEGRQTFCEERRKHFTGHCPPDLCRSRIQVPNPNPFSVTVAGHKRPRTSAPYDFGLRGRRIEVKSAQLNYDKSHRRYWQAMWQNLKSTCTMTCTSLCTHHPACSSISTTALRA